MPSSKVSEQNGDNGIQEHDGPASGMAASAEASLHSAVNEAEIGSGTTTTGNRTGDGGGNGRIGLSRPDAPITIAGMSDALGTWEGDARAAAFEEEFSQPDTLQLVSVLLNEDCDLI